MNSVSDNEELSQFNDQHSESGVHFNSNEIQFAENGEFLFDTPSLDERKSCTCKDCGKVFNSVWYLKQHAVKHSSERPFKCKYCHKTYRFRSNLYQHKCPSRDRAYEINGSRKSSSQRSATKRKSTTHLMVNSSDDSYNNSTTATKMSSLKMYSKTMHNSSSSTNGKLVASKSSVHSTSHTNNGGAHGNNNLDGCGEDSCPSRPGGESVQKYSNQSSSTCSPTSEEVKQFLDRHKEHLHKCAQCKILFPSREYLTRHMSWHDVEESKVKCTFCSELFHNEQQYGLHKQTHVPHSLYICLNCKGKFCHQLALKKHMVKCCSGKTWPATPTPQNGIYNPALFVDRTPPSTPVSEFSPFSAEESDNNMIKLNHSNNGDDVHHKKTLDGDKHHEQQSPEDTLGDNDYDTKSQGSDDNMCNIISNRSSSNCNDCILSDNTSYNKQNNSNSFHHSSDESSSLLPFTGSNTFLERGTTSQMIPASAFNGSSYNNHHISLSLSANVMSNLQNYDNNINNNNKNNDNNKSSKFTLPLMNNYPYQPTTSGHFIRDNNSCHTPLLPNEEHSAAYQPYCYHLGAEFSSGSLPCGILSAQQMSLLSSLPYDVPCYNNNTSSGKTLVDERWSPDLDNYNNVWMSSGHSNHTNQSSYCLRENDSNGSSMAMVAPSGVDYYAPQPRLYDNKVMPTLVELYDSLCPGNVGGWATSRTDTPSTIMESLNWDFGPQSNISTETLSFDEDSASAVPSLRENSRGEEEEYEKIFAKFQCNSCLGVFNSSNGLRNHLLRKHVFDVGKVKKQGEKRQPSTVVRRKNTKNLDFQFTQCATVENMNNSAATEDLNSNCLVIPSYQVAVIVKKTKDDAKFVEVSNSKKTSAQIVAEVVNRQDEVPMSPVLHSSEETETETFRCSYCPKTFRYKRYVKKHERLQHELPDERNGEISSLIYSLKNKETYKLKCPRCVKRFCSARLLKQHLAFHNRAEKIQT